LDTVTVRVVISEVGVSTIVMIMIMMMRMMMMMMMTTHQSEGECAAAVDRDALLDGRNLEFLLLEEHIKLLLRLSLVPPLRRDHLYQSIPPI
jgi:hypothetical protein